MFFLININKYRLKCQNGRLYYINLYPIAGSWKLPVPEIPRYNTIFWIIPVTREEMYPVPEGIYKNHKNAFSYQTSR
jgi:hypothetical protein